MAHLDMKTFLETNKDVINPKYWIMSADSQQCAIMDVASGGFAGTIDEASMVAPMQGFFVEAKSESSSIDIKFTPEMIRTVSGDKNAPGLLRSRAVVGSDAISLSALDDNTHSMLSKAILRISSESAADYKECEDALLFGDSETGSPMIYTISGNKAASINTTPKADGIEIGLLANNDDTYKLRFDNIAAIDGYSVYDRTTGESHPLYEGMEYLVNGPVSGRLYLYAGDSALEMDQSAKIRIILKGDVICAVSPDNKTTVELSVYDMAGRHLDSSIGQQGYVEANVSAEGFYIVVAKDSDGREARRKVIL